MKQGFMKISAALQFLALVLAVLVAPATFAQTETGQIHGTVTDQSGAAVPKAKVVVRNVGNGAERAIETDERGSFAATNLLPGIYSVTVEAANLAKKEARVEVFVGKPSELNFQLTVGATTTVVEVIGQGGVQVNTESQTLSSSFDGLEMRTLPTLNRDPYANVGNVGTASDSDPSGRGAGGISFNGLRAASTNILLDGSANNNEFTASVGQTLPLDAIEELSVITNNFTAEYGRASGAIVNVVTKSGTNELHGSAYEYNRVSDLASNSFFNNANGNPKPNYVRNQFGGRLGGPVKKNKIFYFGNFEENRIRSSAERTRWVVDPTFVANADAATQGFYSSFGTLRSNIRQLGTTTLNGVLGGACPAGGTLAYGIAAPKTISCDSTFMDQVNYSVPADAGAGSPQNELLAVGKVDWNISDKTTVYARYAVNKQSLFSGTISDSAYSGYDTGEEIMQNNFLVSMTHSFNSRLTSQSKIVFNRLNDFQPLGSQPISPGLYVSPSATATFQGRDIVMPGYLPTTPGNGIPFGGPQNFLQAYEDFSYIKGKHTLRFGGSYDYQRDNRTFGAYETPVASFRTSGSAWTSGSVRNFLNGQLAQFQGAINPQGHFPCPFPITAGQPCQDPSTGSVFVNGNVTTPVNQPVFARSNRYHEFGVYGADQWKMTNRLTLNLGLRWEYFGIQHNKNPQLDSNFYFPSGLSIFNAIRNGGVELTSQSTIGGLWAKDWNNFGPKLGFAWDMFGNGKTVLRGGYSIAYERNFGNVTFNVIQNPPNYSVISIINGTDTPANSLPVTTDPAGPLAGTGVVKAIPKVSLRAVNPNIRTSFAHQFGLTFEHEVRRGILVGFDYSGSYGEKLYDIANVNRPGQGNVSLGDVCTPVTRHDTFNNTDYTIPAYPCFNSVNFNDGSASGFTVSKNQMTRLLNTQYSNINFRSDQGKSHYNALVARIGMRNWASTGLTLDANYTYSHCLDELSDTFSSSGNNFNLGYLDPFQSKVDYGNCYQDIRHRFTAQGIWEVPFGKHMTGWKKQVADGWSISPIFVAETGSPFTVYDCTNGFTVCMYAVNAAGTSGLPHNGKAAPISGSDVPGDFFNYLNFYSSVGFDPATGDVSSVGTPLFDSSYNNPIAGVSDFGPFPSGMNARNRFRGPGSWNLSIAVGKSFTVRENLKLILRGEAYNLFNHANLFVAGGDTDVSQSQPFVDAFKDGNRVMQLAVRLEF
ncbi:MAG TPA: TonB-dependent receptor [Candidatus Acidoferrum sp.]|nr:TonB-dependent receptor [Candidatus Acidoferrum sp.]